MKGYIVHSTHPDTPSIGFIYIGCVDDVCLLHMFATFAPLLTSECWVCLSAGYPFLLHPSSGSLLQHPISVVTWPQVSKKSMVFACIYPETNFFAPRNLHLPTIEYQGVLHAFAVCFRDDILSLCFGKTWGVEVLSDLLHRSAEICHIETPRGRKSSELQGILKMVPWLKRLEIVLYRWH